MKIKIALMPIEHISQAQALSIKLEDALEKGAMSTVDEVTEVLISLSDSKHSLSLPEDYWHKFIKKVRAYDDHFMSDYIMDKPQLEVIIAADVVESFTDVSGVVEHALKIDGVVLQLPFEEGSADV
ncbi:hypothetical protein [Marinomonas foliarum]|uniref:Uncharacterized protein n=1 Tax=Marinomonas foliarum TaxID=491950 RepID=A0A368ZC14_9GAMM|nr:hypothetical protein [Marinomonas foliarum]RCW90408.1 hypothetical protein DFP77_1743 [Marinomonas foliarum]